jgi:hypothetical protein
VVVCALRQDRSSSCCVCDGMTPRPVPVGETETRDSCHPKVRRAGPFPGTKTYICYTVYGTRLQSHNSHSMTARSYTRTPGQTAAAPLVPRRPPPNRPSPPSRSPGAEHTSAGECGPTPYPLVRPCGEYELVVWRRGETLGKALVGHSAQA